LEPIFKRIKEELLPIVRKIYALRTESKDIEIDTKDEKRNLEIYKEILEKM